MSAQISQVCCGENPASASSGKINDHAARNRTVRLISACIAVKLVLLFALAWNSRFVMDEYWQLGQSKYLFNGYFETMWPPKSVGYMVFYKPAYWLGWDSVSTVLIGRLLTAMLGCGTVAMVYMCARSLGQDRLRALLVILVLLSFSNFEERIFRTRAEPLALFFATGALLTVLRASADRPLRLVAAGLLSGLSFLTTQKGVYFNGALGIALVIDALVLRRYFSAISRGSWLVLGWAVAVAAYAIAFGGADALRVLEGLFFAPAQLAVHGADPYGSLRYFVVQTLTRNAMLYIICIAGMGVAALKFTQLRPSERIALVFSIVMAVLVFAHNQPWPYVFVMVLPFMALWVPYALGATREDSPQRRTVWIVLSTVIAISIVSNIAYFRTDNRAQINLMTRAEAMLAPEESYYDGTGMLPDRREATPLWLDRGSILSTLDQGSESQAYKSLAEHTPKLLIWSYRLENILPVIGALVQDRYVHVAPNIWMVGCRLPQNREISFEVVRPGKYRLYSERGERLNAPLAINGQSAKPPFDLAAGRIKVLYAGGQSPALLVPEGEYKGLFSVNPDDKTLFFGVYD